MFEFSLPTVLVYIYFSYCLMLIARKLKVNLDMVAWIPILQFFVLTDVAKKPWWYVVLLFVPIVNLFIWYDLWSSIALQMHKSPGWGCVALVPPFSFLVPGYLAYID